MFKKATQCRLLKPFVQSRFPQPRSRLWTWTHPAGSKHQLDHILITNKWVNSLRNCRADCSVELSSDHRILSIRLVTSLRTSKGKPCKRPKFDWKKLQDPAVKHTFQRELLNRFQVLNLSDGPVDISERYEFFKISVKEAADKVVRKRKRSGLPSWESPKTISLKIKRDQAKKEFISSESPKTRDRWRRSNTSLCDSYNAYEAAALSNQLEELRVADEQEDYTTTWKIIHSLSGKDTQSNVKVKMRNGHPPKANKSYLRSGTVISALCTITIVGQRQQNYQYQLM